MLRKRPAVLLLVSVALCTAQAQDTVFSAQTRAPLDEVYLQVYESLENRGLYVVFEVDLGSTMARFKDRWGEDYNRNALEGIKTMVVCNARYANRVGNADPTLLALCPLRVALTHKEGVTTVLFARPTVIARGSPAEPVVKELEETLVGAIREALKE